MWGSTRSNFPPFPSRVLQCDNRVALPYHSRGMWVMRGTANIGLDEQEPSKNFSSKPLKDLSSSPSVVAHRLHSKSLSLCILVQVISLRP